MRRRLVTVGLAAGIAMFMALMGSVPANAATKWQSHGLTGVSAHGSYYKGSYHGRATKVLDTYIKDTRKDGYTAAILVAWTEKGYEHDYQYIYNRHGAGTTAHGTYQSYNTSHLYIKECLGHVKSGKFKASKCGSYRKYY